MGGLCRFFKKYFHQWLYSLLQLGFVIDYPDYTVSQDYTQRAFLRDYSDFADLYKKQFHHGLCWQGRYSRQHEK